MATLTPQQIAGYASAAGFSGTGLQWAVAVALAESGGRTDAVGQNTDKHKSVDRGLWQINSYWHPEVTAAATFDPRQAAAAAFRISKGGTDWSPWVTAKNGAALAQLGRASLAAAAPTSAGGTAQNVGLEQLIPGAVGGLSGLFATLPGTADALGDSPLAGSGGVVGGVTDSIVSIGKAMSVFASGYLAYLEWITQPHNWVRITYVVLGGAGAVAGLVMLSQTGVEGPVGAVADGAAKATSGASKAAKATVGTVATAGAAAASGGTSLAVQGTAKVGSAAVKAGKAAKAAGAAAKAA